MAGNAKWKVVTAGVAMAGLGVVAAGAANAATEPAPIAVNSAIEAPLVDWVDFDDDSPDDSFIAMDDSWDDTWWEDTWDD